MRRAPRLALLAVLVALAGCAGFLAGGPGDATSTPTDAPTATLTATEAETQTTVAPTPTETTTPTATPEPTETYTIVTPSPTATQTETPTETEQGIQADVVVNVSDAPEFDATSLVRDSADYWEGTGSEYVDDDWQFVIRNGTDYRTDVVVYFVRDIYEHAPKCGTNAMGCTVPSEEYYAEVYLEPCDDRESMLNTTKHEFGHVVGLDHDDEPQPLMAALVVDSGC